MIKVYAYSGCDGCKKAIKWLNEHSISHELLAIRETPPIISELRAMLKFQSGNLKKLFNVSGQDYRKMGLRDQLPTLSEDDALALLEKHGNLVKRPFLISENVGLVGFKADVWSAALS